MYIYIYIYKTIKLYYTMLIEKVELFIKGMKSKAHLYKNSEVNTSYPLNYIFKSRKCPA